MLSGHVPYRDFPLEYPPAALVAFLLPALVAGTRHFAAYERAFELPMALCAAGAVATGAYLLARETRERGRLLVGVCLGALAPLLLGPVMLSRYDAWPALLSIAAVAAIVLRHERAGFGLVALAVAAKGYPLAIVPLLLVYTWRTRGPGQTLRCLSVFAAVLLGVLAPFLVLAPHGLWASLVNQATRPLQIETLAASFLLVAHQVLGTHLSLVASHGSTNLGGSTATALAHALGYLQIAVVAAITVLFARGPATRDRLVMAAAAAICAFVTLDRVLSPQYLIWLIPFVIAVPRGRGLAAASLLGTAMVLTQLWFPGRYFQLLALAPLPSWLVFGRDLLLLALLVTLAKPIAGVGIRRASATVRLPHDERAQVSA